MIQGITPEVLKTGLVQFRKPISAGLCISFVCLGAWEWPDKVAACDVQVPEVVCNCRLAPYYESFAETGPLSFVILSYVVVRLKGEAYHGK